MTTEEKAKRFDEALAMAKKCITYVQDEGVKKFMLKMYPELKESEDERIRKALIQLVNQCDGELLHPENARQMLTWLEKGEQKPDNKVEPKFKVGDWVVSPNGVYWHIDAINNNRYEVSSTDGARADWPLNTSLYRLWTIQNAKEGDILANNGNIILFKEISNSARKDYKYIKSFCLVLAHSFDFYTGGSYNLDDGFHPATKEQRDTLMKAMADARYTFDFEKKELKNIEQKPAEWTHKDGKNLAELWEILSVHRNTNPQVDNLMEWVKDLVSYKRQEWSEEDIRKIKLICTYLDAYKAYQTTVGAEYIDGCISWAKALISRVGCEANCTTTWKPSNEMLEALYRVIPENVMEKSEDEMLLDKLYQGLKYGRVLSEK